MSETIKNRDDATRWQRKYDAEAPKVGDMAPDFELRDASGDRPIRLSSVLRDKPVALIFGSFT